MSSDELKAQKGEVLVEYQEVEDQIKALMVKAARIGGVIKDFGERLEKNPMTKIYRGDQETHNILVETVPEAFVAIVRGWEIAFDIADALRQAQKRLNELSEQKRMLGIR